jgi:mannose/fructose/N-acetylgalactosamine-specific phosphotransferase system component IID
VGDKLLTICATILLALILGGAFALAWHGSITGDQALTLAGVIATAAVSIFGVHLGVKAGANAASTSPPPKP